MSFDGETIYVGSLATGGIMRVAKGGKAEPFVAGRIRHTVDFWRSDGRKRVDGLAQHRCHRSWREGIHPDAGAPEVKEAKLQAPAGTTADEVALGAKVFSGQVDGGTCAGCHGDNAKGTPIGPPPVKSDWLWGDGSLKAIDATITNGVAEPKNHPGVMPPKGGAAVGRRCESRGGLRLCVEPPVLMHQRFFLA